MAWYLIKLNNKKTKDECIYESSEIDDEKYVIVIRKVALIRLKHELFFIN